MGLGTRGTRAKPPCILVADPAGYGAALVQAHAPRLGVEVIAFEHSARLAMHAGRHGADLVVFFTPTSFAALERLRNDGRTRHIPVLLCTNVGHDEERRFEALTAADQVVDHPFEAEVVVGWIERGLKRAFDRGIDLEFARARLSVEGEARWTGRVSWVSGNRLRFETDLYLPEGAELALEGPLVSALGVPKLDVRVIAQQRDDVFYYHAARYELQVLPGQPLPPGAFDVDPHAIAPAKVKIGVIGSGARFADLCGALDTAKFAVRWIANLEGFGPKVAHLRPALIVADPAHPDLDDAMRAGSLVRISKEIPVLPLTPRPAGKVWARFGPGCPTLDVPPLEPGAWTDLVTRSARPLKEPVDPDRRYVRRDHRFSHARLVTPVTLVGLTEIGCEISCPFALGERARARIDIAPMIESGVQPLHARVLRAAKLDEPAKMVFMGIGNEDETRRLRLYVQDAILAKRRQEFEESV